MILARLTVGPFAENVYLIGKPPRIAVVDPGGESDRILATIHEQNWRPEAILLTHAHVDHIAHAAPVAEHFGIGVTVHAADLPLLRADQAPFAALLGARPCPEPERFVADGDELAVAGLTLRVIHTPGHTLGGVCFVDEESRQILVGDTIFHRGIGRTDLPGGDYETLEVSIRERLFPLPGDYRLWPGHGPETWLSEEREENPFFGRRRS